MELCDINTVRELLRRHGFQFKKAMGQNFLVASWVPERIAESSGADSGSGVLEIGPGVGCLTVELARLAGSVVSVELDSRLLPVLSETLVGLDNVTVVPGDILKLDLPALVNGRFPGLRPMVCANLPYNITSPVITKLLRSRLFSSVTVMVQREVALRMAAEPGSKDYGAFTLLCRFYSEPELLFDVPAGCFEPPPKVQSAVVRMRTLPEPPEEVDEELFFRVVRAAFNQRRKTLQNALSSGFPELTKPEIADAISSAGLPGSVRGEALGLHEFAELTNVLSSSL